MHAISAVAKKLQVKSGKRWLFYCAPENYLATIEPVPEGTECAFDLGGDFDGVQLFVKDSSELKERLKVIMPVLKPDTIFWITYPKKSSGIPSDLEMMRSWDEPAVYGYNGVTAAAIDQTWTALRFRLLGQSKVSDSCNEEIKKNEYANYIDIDNKQIMLPEDMHDVLASAPAAMEFYQNLSYSNKKEYVIWILSAKQEKTKQERLIKLVEKLSAGKKNPAEK